MATADRMLRQMKRLGVAIPTAGTGRNGKILNSDLERALENYYMAQSAPHSWGRRARQALREPMLSYRFDKLSEEQQDYLLQDNNEWAAEEKYDGCRMIVTFAPEEGFMFFGRNRSVNDYLPIDYTSKIVINGHLGSECAGLLHTHRVWDAELITEGYVETQEGRFTGAKLNAAVAVLQLNEADSHLAQLTTAPLQCVLFDVIPLTQELRMLPWEFSQRRDSLIRDCHQLADYGLSTFFQLSSCLNRGKKAFLDKVLSEGKEGLILKNLNGVYVPGINGYRDKSASVKVKRTMTGALGEEIDAYVIGYTNGPEHAKEGCIAGLKLAVQLRAADGTLTEHWIATVSGIPQHVRSAVSECGEGPPALRKEFYGQVLAIDGQDISARNRRIAHARADWRRGFRDDKTAAMCIMDEEFIDGQLF